MFQVSLRDKIMAEGSGKRKHYQNSFNKQYFVSEHTSGISYSLLLPRCLYSRLDGSMGLYFGAGSRIYASHVRTIRHLVWFRHIRIH